MISFKMADKYDPNGPLDNNLALFQTMVSEPPLSESKMTQFNEVYVHHPGSCVNVSNNILYQTQIYPHD